MARNPFATFRFITDSQNMNLQCNPTLYTSYPAWSHLRVSVDGVLSYHLFSDTVSRIISLGIGTKTVEITESGTSKPGISVLGTFITSVRLEKGSTFTIIDTDFPANKKLFFGDSITTGSNCTYLTDSFAMKFRDAGENVSVLGYGYGSVTKFAGSEILINDTVSKIDSLLDGTATNELIILLGTNDYAVDETPVATFQAYYSDLLIAINVARSDIIIKCVSPTVRTSEVANGNGDTLPDFRIAINNACTGKSYCTYIDGSTLIAIGDLDDGVHPSNAGHIALYNALVSLV